MPTEDRPSSAPGQHLKQTGFLRGPADVLRQSHDIVFIRQEAAFAAPDHEWYVRVTGREDRNALGERLHEYCGVASLGVSTGARSTGLDQGVRSSQVIDQSIVRNISDESHGVA